MVTASRLVLAGALLAAPLLGGSTASEHWNTGMRHMHAERFRDAETAFRQAARLDPESSSYALWVGLAIGRRAERMTGIRRLGALPLAKQVKHYFERAVELDGSNLEALEALQNFHREAPGMAGGSAAEARRLADRLQGLDRARGAAAWALLLEQGQDFAAAEARHARARELAPRTVGHLLGHASFLARRGRHAESDALFEQALSREPENPDVWLAAGKAWIRAGRRTHYPRARELLERYLASPDRGANSEPPYIVRRLLSRT